MLYGEGYGGTLKTLFGTLIYLLTTKYKYKFTEQR